MCHSELVSESHKINDWFYENLKQVQVDESFVLQRDK
ncbi:hypothetical protein Murru_1009 [Allomuricauda ruestringensis DSM 13258]|uniref:Uncharacterized protein n=1 Tax=Allomuricauda ruestringensis (strain DSM 13258 / CIP 107369 / LMG 19739 / B1) TaxID=886377 RepID=G2PM15_ALLRU|nr:hypothetical protein Murru_1009 [Allomuricauda ruestringensis DSM 13258]